MAGIVLTEPPKPFACVICARPEWVEKMGPSCQGCPAFKGTHFYPRNNGPEVCDLIVLGDAPAPPPLVQFVGGTQFNRPTGFHLSFDDTPGRVIKGAVDRVLQLKEYEGYQAHYTYAVKCAQDNPNKLTIETCSKHFKALVHDLALRRKAAGRQGPLVILACGVDALLACGVPVKKEDEALNRVFENVVIADTKVSVVFTRSLKALGLQDGKYNNLLADVERAMRIVSQTTIKVADRKEVEKNYVYPSTLAELRDLVDHVINYSENGVDPKDWKIAFDTETNTLHPNWSGTKMIAASFAWGVGRAAGVPLWHAETPYDPAAGYEEIKRLLVSQKPVIWFNGKYDYKVFWRLGWPQTDVGNVYWDALLAEHALEEDKKNFYSLKALTKQFLPHLAGYEDKLHEILEVQNETLTVTVPTGGKELKLPPAVAESLVRLLDAKVLSSQAFRVPTAKKLLEDPKKAQWHDDLRMVIGAKEAGEFQKPKSETKKKQDTGGFEHIPLKELLFYAAVDVDATRRIAVMQVQRMAKEDKELEAKRNDIRKKQSFSRDPKISAFPVQVLCNTPRPLFHLVKNDYLPRQRELAKIEYNGVNVDQQYVRWGMESLGTTIEATRNQVFELCGEEFKLGSGPKIAQYLFGIGYKHPDMSVAEAYAAKNPGEVFVEHGRVRYTPHAYTAKGQIQTADGVLKSLITRFEDPLANLLLTHKKADKAKNTFFANILSLATYFGDGKLHPGFGLHGTSTGRLSSSVRVGDARFNAQNIPKGYIGALKDLHGKMILDEHGNPVFEGVKCKKLFIPDDDSYVFGNADAKGAEVSVFAAYSNDAALIEALTQGLDSHCFFASEALNPKLVAGTLQGEERRLALERASIDEDHGWTYNDFLLGKDDLLEDKVYGARLKKIRDNIKRLVFGMLYGAGVRKTAEIAGISLELAKKIQDLLFAKFPTIKAFMERTKWELRTFGVVESFQGRRRRFLLGAGAPNELRAKAERRALNFKVQSTNSDIVMTVLCWIAEILERDMGGRLLMTVHDSIVFQVPKRYAGQMEDLFLTQGTQRVAKTFSWMPVPYRWDVELGASYGEVKPAKAYMDKVGHKYIQELDGYTEEDAFDDMRDPDAYELAEYTKKPLPRN